VKKAVRGKTPLVKVGVETVGMYKTMTGAIIVEVPGGKDWKMASTLVSRKIDT
jgi:hypothetical protein